MKKLTYFIAPVIAMSVGMASCSKDDNKTTTPTTTTPTATGPTAATPATPGDVDGALISVRMDYNSQPAGSPVPVKITSEIGLAVFFSAPGSSTKLDAGTVTVNTYNLDKGTDNSYSKVATIASTPADLNFDNGSSWNVGGSGSVTAFSVNHTAAFPSFDGTMPSSITKSSGLTIQLDNSTLSGADSVLVLVAAGSKSFTKTFGPNAGTATISAAELSGFPAVTDNSAVMEVCPYNFTTTTKNGKKYVMIKEQAVVKNININ